MGPGGWALVGARLARARPGLLALAVLTNLGCYAAWALRWRAMLRPVARVPWWPAQKALMISILVNTVVPFARSLGGLVRAAALGRDRALPTASLYGPTLVDQVGYSAVSLGLGALSVPLAAWSGGAGRGRTAAYLLAALAVVAAIAIALRGRRAAILDRIRARVPAAAGSVEQAVAAARAVLFRPRTWGVVAAGGAAVWLFNVLTFLLAGRAIGASFGLGGAAAAWSLGSIAGVASGTPGGVGTTESAAIVPLIALGVAPSEALAAVLLARLIHYVSAILIGWGCFLAAGKQRPPPRTRSARRTRTGAESARSGPGRPAAPGR